MKILLLVSFISLLFIGCKQEDIEDETYGYETECEYCDIDYVDDMGEVIYVSGHKGLWKKDFPRSVFSDMRVTVTARQIGSYKVSAHIVKNGKRLVSQSGNSIVTARHSVYASESSKPISSICGAPTKKGGPCQRKVSGGGRCWQHR